MQINFSQTMVVIILWAILYKQKIVCIGVASSIAEWLTLREKSPYSELFWSVFSRIWTEYGEILRLPPYLVRMQENMYIYMKLIKLKRTHIYIYNTLYMCCAYNYTLYVLSEDGDRQQLLRAELNLVKFPTSTTLVVTVP